MDKDELSRELSQGDHERPFYFNLVVWGAGFRRYFLEYCLPSLLSPRNIPALPRGRGSKFLIATHAEDWSILSAAPIFARLAEYVEPVFVELPAEPLGGRETDFNGLGYNLGLMGVGHQLISAMAFRDHAYAVYLAPDTMLSDGSVEHLDAHAKNGVELVLCAALRLAEEPFFAGLEAQGIALGASCVASGMPLAISGRQMINAAINGFHSETLTYEWDARYFRARRPSGIWWRVPGERGVLLHGLNWMPLLLDFGAVDKHDVSGLQKWTLDGDYVYQNIGTSDAVYVVQDSDEIFMASWAPAADRPRDVSRRDLRWDGAWRRKFSDACKGFTFQDVFYSGYFDPLKQRAFFVPIRWHADDLNENWRRAEVRVRRLLGRFVLSPEMARPERGAFLHGCKFLFVVTPLRVAGFVDEYWEHRGVIRARLGEMMRGDIRAWRRVAKRMRGAMAHILAKSH